jgi:hypothetical protein
LLANAAIDDGPAHAASPAGIAMRRLIALAKQCYRC